MHYSVGVSWVMRKEALKHRMHLILVGSRLVHVDYLSALVELIIYFLLRRG